LVELSATIRHLERNLLIKAGYQVEAVLDFESALCLLLPDSNDLDIFDAVIMGWPGDSILEADRLIKLLKDSTYSSLPLLICAHESESMPIAALDKRPNTLFLNWLEYRKSTDLIALLLTAVKQTASHQNNKKPIVQPIKVLFVDDSRTVRVKYKNLLTQNGYLADTAATVAEGYEKALASQFDIAIIDYFMPDATGDALCRQLREHPATTSISTAIITGSYLDKAIKQSLQAGAVECMFKNESDDLFLTRIDAMSRHIRAHRSIVKERELLGGILRSVGEGVFGVNSDGYISFVNPACRRILGYAPDDRLIGSLAKKLLHNNGEAKNDIVLGSGLNNKNDRIKARETLFLHKSGSALSVECTVYPLTIEDKCEGSVVAFRDISERKLLEEELRWQATHDALTKLFNRRYFEEQLDEEAKRLKRSCESSALLYIDLDRFKYINDTAGHAAGDRLLVEISQQIRRRLRHTDLLARLGGDEFAIILRNVDRKSILSVAEEYRQMLDYYMFVYNGKQYKVNGTIGIALFDKDSESAGEILANADIACHIAKGEGRNRTHLFVPNNDNKKAMDHDLGWSSRLHTALEENHLVLHYQPILPLKHFPSSLMLDTNKPIYEKLLTVIPEEQQINELLIRLDDPVWGIIYPGAFLPTAERFNMMDRIDSWVVSAAVNKLEHLQKQGYKGMFTINLSGQTISNKALIEDIEQLIVNSLLDPQTIIFEITETSAVSNLMSATEMITRLSGLGCRFALDDFGSGFSSFSHLKNLPVDYIKVDGLFVRGVATDPSDRAIVQSMNDIAHSLGKKTVAEYVENAAILRFLHESGVDYVQGHFVSKPIDIKEIESRIHSNTDHSASTKTQTTTD
jgi:diguanylate cyclase (GGDEF)-like protein/PAS domain S-box-containing protein